MYIGNTVITQGFTPQVDFFSGNASTTAFTLSRPVASVYQMIVNVANVDQNPGSAYTVTGNTITFASAPPSGTNNIWVEYTSLITQTIVPTGSYQVSGPVYTGTSSPLGGATNPITGNTGSANNYIQTYIYNTYNGVNSSADFTAYPSNGSDSSGWVDMGITGPTFSQAAYSVTGANEPYLFGSAPSGSGTSGNLVIATDSTGTTNAIQFYTGGFTKAKSAFAMMIDQNGNVGVGVTPSTWTTYKAIQIGGVINSFVGNTGGGTDMVQNAYYNSGWKYASTGAASIFDAGDLIGGGFAWRIAPSGTVGNAITFTTAMTLDNNGNLAINTGGNTFSYAPLVGQSSSTSGAAGMYYYNSNTGYQGNGISTYLARSANAGGYLFLGVSGATGAGSGGTAVFYVDGTGVIHSTSTSITAISDQTLKTNIKTLETGLAEINKLQPRRFDWLDGSGTNIAGFISQEVQTVFPDLTPNFVQSKNDDGTTVTKLGLKMGDMIPTMVKAIQELSAKVTALEAKVA